MHKANGPIFGELRGATYPTLTAGQRFIGAVGAVGPSIAVPVGGDAAATGAAKLTLGTCGCS